ncbi:MAG: hypothetical protein FD157_1964 [Rhodocyclaceae bacterium]|nr:MAG: hypothetical protein FD157_1964 [Rhodocyclaceae bacterium]TND00958.1 MAG: hypothetical protein FD118_2748 [Rhodocyclaceae bacterium]
MLTSEQLKRFFAIAIGFTLVGGLAWGLIVLTRTFWEAFTQLNPTVAAGMLAAVTTVLVSVVSVLYSKHLEQKLNIRKEHREKKVPVYEDLITFLFRVIYAQKEGAEPLSDKEIVDTYSRLTQNAIIWASDDVIKAFHKFRAASLAKQENYLPLALSVEDLFLAIRRDLGHKNHGIAPGQLLGMFINDLHKSA